MPRDLTDLERRYYAACDRAVALRQELAETLALIDQLRREISAALMRGDLATPEATAVE